MPSPKGSFQYRTWDWLGTRESMLSAILKQPVVKSLTFLYWDAELGAVGENSSSQTKMSCCFILLNPSVSLWLSKYDINAFPTREVLMSPEQNTIIFS